MRPHNPAKGSKNSRAKLSEDIIPKIKAMIDAKDYSDNFIAAHFGVTRKAIYDIRTGKTWTHVK